MKKLNLVIKEKGRYVKIPGLPPFRSPAKVDVSKIKIPVLIQSLHSCGVSDYKIVSVDENKIYTKTDFESHDKNRDNLKLEKRLGRLEDLLITVLSSNYSQNNNESEQITNRLSLIEQILRKGVRPSTEIDDKIEPVIEEIEDIFIPSIDVDNMTMSSSSKSTEVITKKSKHDVDDAVDLLSSLTDGGNK